MKRQYLKTDYVCVLPLGVQTMIANDLSLHGMDLADVQIALDSRLCDLEDVINVNRYLSLINQ